MPQIVYGRMPGQPKRRVGRKPPISNFRFEPITGKSPKTSARYGGPIKVRGLGQQSHVGTGFRFTTISLPGASVRDNPVTESQSTTTSPYIIHGVLVKSVNEWYTYQALLRLGIPDYAIGYQVPWHGGKVFGGQVLDFVIDLGGALTAIRVMGLHWHPTAFGKPLDAYTRSQLQADGYRVEDIPDTYLQSTEAATQELSRLRIA